MPPVGSETAITASERLQNHALDRAAIRTGLAKFSNLQSLVHNDTSSNSMTLSLTSFITLNIKLVQKRRHLVFGHKVCHPRCVYNKLGYVYTCLTQLCGGIDMYNLLHKDQLHVSTLIIGHLQVDN